LKKTVQSENHIQLNDGICESKYLMASGSELSRD